MTPPARDVLLSVQATRQRVANRHPKPRPPQCQIQNDSQNGHKSDNWQTPENWTKPNDWHNRFHRCRNDTFPSIVRIVRIGKVRLCRIFLLPLQSQIETVMVKIIPENDLTPPARDVLLSVQATRQRDANRKPPATTRRDATPPQRKPEAYDD